MLKRARKGAAAAVDARVAIVASEYNRRHVDSLLDEAMKVLREADAEVEVHRVPGAFEIPVVAEELASRRGHRWSAVICLGVVIRGETSHADLIGTAVTNALMDIGLRHRIPVIHEVLLVANREQADARCLDPRFNRGREAAQAALAMARLVGRIRVHGNGVRA
jgi:6,7-dimethyl-8-ribityllumazine synthase